MKKYIIVSSVIALVVIGIGLYFALNMQRAGSNLAKNNASQTVPVQSENTQPTTNTPQPNNPTVTETQPQTPVSNGQTVIGKSVGGRDITAYQFGTGDKEILLVGGIHGGYSWNTSLLAYQLMDYLKANPTVIPANIKVTVIPALNPDGLSKVVDATGPFKSSDVSTSPAARTAGRFNADNVDLNRNFDCGWKANAVWQNTTVSGGTAVFSEPESAAIRDYAQAHQLTALVAWYSSGGGVYSSSCSASILPETQTITDIYAKASGYAAYKNFESYAVSGDMTDWFAKNNIPAIGVLLTTANDTELDKNQAGIMALLLHYAQ